jgi:hypothetical protein
MGSLYNGTKEWTDYDAVKTTKQVYLLLKKRWSCSQAIDE